MPLTTAALLVEEAGDGADGEGRQRAVQRRSSARARGGELEIVGGRALERRAPRSRMVVVSSGSGGALLAHKPASGRPAWAGRAPAANEELSVNQGWVERVRALLSPAAQ